MGNFLGQISPTETGEAQSSRKESIKPNSIMTIDQSGHI